MTEKVRLTLLVALISTIHIPVTIYAEISNNFSVNRLIEQAQTQHLAKNPTWLKLVHYTSKDRNQSLSSDINSPSFFIAKNGKTDPEAELTATIKAMLELPEQDQNEHAQCQFPARYQWLKTTLGQDLPASPKIDCTEFKKWSQNGKIESVSAVFATGYLGNPASYYGHILLKFNTQDNLTSDDLLDSMINYGAIVPERENSILYILKGLFGGYQATYSQQKFFRYNHNYTENELRDLWEYELNLNQQEVDLIVAHSWELLGKEFTYYFLDDNCAYRMADLLELVVDTPLLSKQLPWSAPYTIFDRLMQPSQSDKPIVREVRLIPSRQSRFYSKYAVLTNDQKHLIKKLATDLNGLESPRYQRLPNSQKIRVIETLFDYYEFQTADKTNDFKLKSAKQTVLLERLKLPKQRTSWAKVKGSGPHNGQKPGMIRTGLFHNSSYGLGTEFGIRATYYDFLALNAGRPINSTLIMGDIRFAYAGQKFWLRQLDFVSIETLNLSRTGLPGDGGLAWKFKLGFDSEDLSCRGCTVFSLNGGLGKAIPLSQSISLSTMLDGRFQVLGNNGIIAITPRLGVLSTPMSPWKTHLSVGYRVFLDNPKSKAPIIRWENRFGTSRSWDFRLIYEVHIAHQFKSAFSVFW